MSNNDDNNCSFSAIATVTDAIATADFEYDGESSAQIVEVIIMGEAIAPTEKVKVFSFTQNDLQNGQLIVVHGLNRAIAAVVVSDSTGLEFQTRVSNLNDSSRVLIDMTRYQPLEGTWQVLIR